MPHIKPETWERYKSLVNEFMNDDAAKKEITWYRVIEQPAEFAEDEFGYVPVELKVLVGYNVYRTWPIDKETTSGGIDEQSLVIYASIDYLSANGHIVSGRFNVNHQDRFLIDGKLYIPTGDTNAAQANDNPLLAMQILRNVENLKIEDLKVYGS